MKLLLDMAVPASGLILCTAVLRALFIRRLPKRLFTALWLIAAVRLLTPFSVPVTVNVPLPEPAGETVYAERPAEPVQAGTARAVTAAEETAAGGTARQRQNKEALAAIVWGCGAALSLGVFIWRHRRAMRRCREAVPAENPAIGRIVAKIPCRPVRVRVCQRAAAPFTYGAARPVIVLPKALEWEDEEKLSHVLAHELAHIRRLHVPYKYVLTLAVCVHWCNPLVWVMYALANRDLELVCDEAALTCLGGSREGYALTLISMEESRSLSPLFSGFGARAVEERIRAIMKFKKTGIFGIVLSVVLALGATTVFAAYETRETRIANTAGADGPIQYICEPAYYTAEEFKAAMADEKASIEAEVTAGTLERESADALLKEIDENIQAAENGALFQRPAPVCYADGSPVVNSRGEQLYVKASDIEACNEELRYRYENPGGVAVTAEDTDAVVESLSLTDADGAPDWDSDAFLTGLLDAAEENGGVHWYTYEEYARYVREMEAACEEMEGQWAFNTTDGWYEWTAEDTARTAESLERTLDYVKNGLRVGVTADGGVMMESGSPNFTADATVAADAFAAVIGLPADASSATESAETVVEDTAALAVGTVAQESTAAVHEGGPWEASLLDDYADFGVVANNRKEWFEYNGRPIAGFVDWQHRVMTDGAAKEAGGVYVSAQRDGQGNLTGVTEVTAETFSRLAGLNVMD